MGSRLKNETGETRLKPLLEVGGRALIMRVIDSMAEVGCNKIVVVTGFEADTLEQAIVAEYPERRVGETQLCFEKNPDFKRSNGLSVLAAKEHLDQSFILTMSDHILSKQMVRTAATHQPLEGGATLLIDRKVDEVFDLDDATKVRTDGKRIVAIGKQLTDYDCIDTGIFVCTPGLVDAIAKVAEGGKDSSLSDGVQKLSDMGLMEVLDVGSAFWMDVDTPEMRADAERRLAQSGE
jgi:choline kinase